MSFGEQQVPEFFLLSKTHICVKIVKIFLKNQRENASKNIFHAIFTLKLRITRCRLLEGQSNVTFLRNMFFFFFFLQKIHIDIPICVVLDVCEWEYIVRTFDRFDNFFLTKNRNTSKKNPSK